MVKEKKQETFLHNGKTYKVKDKRILGFYCIHCEKFSKDVVMDKRWNTSDNPDGSTLVFKQDRTSIEPKLKEVWRVFSHYDGCRGWN